MDHPRDPKSGFPPGHGQVLHFRKVGGARDARHGEAEGTQHASELTTADLFAVLWHALADILGTAAAAALLRRAAQRATPAFEELAALVITREGLEYQYRVPAPWSDAAPQPTPALCELVRELWALLVELTGPVVVSRLSQIPELRERGIVPPRERQV